MNALSCIARSQLNSVSSNRSQTQWSQTALKRLKKREITSLWMTHNLIKYVTISINVSLNAEPTSENWLNQWERPSWRLRLQKIWRNWVQVNRFTSTSSSRELKTKLSAFLTLKCSFLSSICVLNRLKKGFSMKSFKAPSTTNKA